MLPVVFAGLIQISVDAQIVGTGGIGYGLNPPATCSVGDVFASTSLAALYQCTSPNSWTALGSGGGGSSVPTGAMILIDSGVCPTGYTENTALAGKTIIGTLSANGNVGDTGGSDTLTPSGTVAAPTFTGSSASTSLVSAGTPAGTNSAPGWTGTAWTPPAVSWPANPPTYAGSVNTLAVTAHTVVATKQGAAAGNVVTTGTHAITGVPGGTISYPANVPTIGAYTPQGSISAPTFSGSALGTHQHTLTATGTNSAPAFTGASGDNRSAFAYVIVCKKN